MAQTVPISSIPTGGPGGFLSGIPGIGGLFGGGGKATEGMQIVQQAELALQTAEQIKHTEALLKQLIAMPQSSAAGVVGDITSLLAELSRMKESFGTIYDDPENAGTYEAAMAYRKLQADRQLGRLDQMADTTASIDAKVRRVSMSADELAALNRSVPGGLAAQQVGNEAALLQLDLERQQILLQQETWRSLAQQEARRAEDEALTKARSCRLWDVEDTEACR